MKAVGKITNLQSFVDWCESKRPFLQTDPYQSSTRRRIAAFGYSASLDNPPKFKPANQDERLSKIANKYQPDWKLALLCLYESGGKIKPHRDSSGYGTVAHSLSTTDFSFYYDGQFFECKAGTIYRFNSKLLHGVKTLTQERWALIWWPPNYKFWPQHHQLSIFQGVEKGDCKDL